MLMFADEVGGWGWPNSNFILRLMIRWVDVSKGQKYTDVILEWSLTNLLLRILIERVAEKLFIK